MEEKNLLSGAPKHWRRWRWWRRRRQQQQHRGTVTTSERIVSEWMWKYAITAVQRDCWLWNTLWSSIDGSMDSLFVANIVTACDIRTRTRVSAHQAHSTQSTIPYRNHCAYNNRKDIKCGERERDKEWNTILAKNFLIRVKRVNECVSFEG